MKKATKKYEFTMTEMDINDNILKLLATEPFYYHVFIALNRKKSTRLPALMAVNIKDITSYNLLYNPDFVEVMNKIEKEQKLNLPPLEETDIMCMLKHEIGHIIMRHVLDPRIEEHSKLWNIATDCALNQMDKRWSKGALKRFVFPKTLEKMIQKMLPPTSPKVSVPKGLDATQYYDLLLKHIPDDQKGEGEGEGGEPGSGPGEYSDASHADWKNIDTDARELIENDLKRIVMEAKEAAQNAGCDTGAFKSIFDSFEKKKTLNWKKVIRRAASYDVSNLDCSFKRPDRRNPGMFPGKIRQETIDFIWGIDTSGSVSESDFNRVLNEIQKIAKQFNKRDIRIIQLDTQITSDKVENVRKMKRKFEFKGRGGTSMKPIFEKLKKEKNHLPVILFTDGYFFEAIDSDKYNFKIIYLLTEDGTTEYMSGKRHKVAKVLSDDAKKK